MWTEIEIDSRRFFLQADQDVDQVKSMIEAAVAAAPTFVTFHGIEQTISVLVQPTTRVVISHDHYTRVEPDDSPPHSPYEDWGL
ncbi:hypothetical protein [Microbacterium sp. Root280D1]|uniref:hypothetical protein n=1 Tax=Microbacterium sp. Root280D1 TaxID=1736510 RepID=UPI000AD0371B|nr:hypothetical protein [Microbacterium sp. Root280D1]